MSRKQNNRLEIGLDTLTLDIPTEYELLENAYDFVSDRTNNIIGSIMVMNGISVYQINHLKTVVFAVEAKTENILKTNFVITS